jgi:hypothetical protein
MSLSMYQASVPVFQHMLGALAGILTKAANHAEARKIDPAVLLQTRLYPDMFPLVRQVQIASDSAKSAAGNLAGVEIPRFEDIETSFPELQERIARTRSYLETFRPGQIDGTEDKDITLTMRGTSVPFKGQQYLLGFALPNFYFHSSAAYAILRHCGVEIGKRDFLGAP